MEVIRNTLLNTNGQIRLRVRQLRNGRLLEVWRSLLDYSHDPGSPGRLSLIRGLRNRLGQWSRLHCADPSDLLGIGSLFLGHHWRWDFLRSDLRRPRLSQNTFIACHGRSWLGSGFCLPRLHRLLRLRGRFCALSPIQFRCVKGRFDSLVHGSGLEPLFLKHEVALELLYLEDPLVLLFEIPTTEFAN